MFYETVLDGLHTCNGISTILFGRIIYVRVGVAIAVGVAFAGAKHFEERKRNRTESSLLLDDDGDGGIDESGKLKLKVYTYMCVEYIERGRLNVRSEETNRKRTIS